MFNSSSKHHGLCGGRGCRPRLRHDHLQAEVVTPLFGKLGWYDQVVQEDPRRFCINQGAHWLDPGRSHHISQIRTESRVSVTARSS